MGNKANDNTQNTSRLLMEQEQDTRPKPCKLYDDNDDDEDDDDDDDDNIQSGQCLLTSEPLIKKIRLYE